MASRVDVCIMAATKARRDWLVDCAGSGRSIRVAGTAPSFPALRSLMAEASVDVAILDWQSDKQPPNARDWLVELSDLVALVVLTPEYDPEIFSRILLARAGGLLRPDASSEQIVHAIQSVASGLMIFDSTLMAPRSGENVLIEPLTPRENEVLRLLADGLPNRDIAARLNISEHTIKFHIGSIFGKLGASSRTEAVTRGLRSGLIEL